MFALLSKMMPMTFSFGDLFLLLHDSSLRSGFYVRKLGLISIEGNSCDSFDVKALIAIDAIVIVCCCALDVCVG